MVATQPELQSLFLICEDLESSLRFYQSLGFEHLKSKTRSHILQAGAHVELHLHEKLTLEENERYGLGNSSKGGCLVHSFAVRDFFELVKKVPPDHLLSGPLETPWGTTIIIVQDPDGNKLEFRRAVFKVR